MPPLQESIWKISLQQKFPYVSLCQLFHLSSREHLCKKDSINQLFGATYMISLIELRQRISFKELIFLEII